MITTAEQYNAYLNIIYNSNPPVFAALPNADNIYNIDLKTREIEAPNILAVERDNVSETIYFIVDRQADYMDLATTSCVITYTNANGVSRVYSVPFYDIYTYDHVDKMIIPWNLDVCVTEKAGEVKFAIQFFKIAEILNTDTNTMEPILAYSLNTKTANSKVLPGIGEIEIGEDYKLSPTDFDIVSDRLTALEQYVVSKKLPHWTIL